MKANEAPERIWIDNLDEGFWFESPSGNKSIEYTRTDAFIEKACAWIRTHSEADYFELIPDANYCGAGNLNKKRMIEDFKKYIRGE